MRRARWLLPSPADAACVLFLFLASVVRGWQAINTDGDLGRHLRVGETILERGGLFYTDLFSWTMAGKPFVPYEWLSEVIYALAHRAAGIPGAIALTALVVAGAYLMLALLLRRLGVDPLLAFLVTVAAGLVGAFHWLARPHVFTLLGTVALLWILEAPGERATRRPALGAVPTFLLFALWANLHGGFLFGLVLVGMYLAGDVIGERASLPRHAVVFVAALAGACVNPVGPALLGHVTGYLGKSFLVDMTLEYRSPDFHGWIGRAFLAVLIAAVAGLALSRRRMSWPHLVVFLGCTAFALHSVRNGPLWALAALPLVAMHLDAEWRALPAALLTRFRAAFESAERESGTGVWAGAAAAGLVLLALSGGGIGGVQLLERGFDPRVFPVEAVERLRREGFQGRMFNELSWGGYVLYAWPEQKVFIDGQTDFYGEALAGDYVRLRATASGWDALLTELEIDLVILPSEAPLAHGLHGDSGWTTWRTESGVQIAWRARPS